MLMCYILISMHACIMLDQAPLLPSLCSFFLAALVDILFIYHFPVLTKQQKKTCDPFLSESELFLKIITSSFSFFFSFYK